MRRAFLAAAVLGALAGGVGIGFALDSPEDHAAVASAAPGPVDIGFAQDMTVHHEQAVQMAQLVRPRTKDPKIAALADGILTDQLLDIGAMRGYLTLWGAPMLPSGPPMTWMLAHDGPMTMPGMASAAQLDGLRTATGTALDRMFLDLMLRHHQGGQVMLTDAQQNAEVPAVRNLAARITFHQQEETRTISALLAAER
jgi:uncharacterized protein (DUF305 family)